MASNYKRYLAEKVISDQEHVTYRALSRALNVHCNHAKRMLYEFHRHENSKKPKSVNATYLLTGVLAKQNGRPGRGTLRDGDDEIMQSSPFVSSQVAPDDASSEEEIPVTSVLLVREDELEDAKRRFMTLYSIFIYSVQPTSPTDLNVLADITSLVSTKDPLQYGPGYGMIQNKNVKRRTGPIPPPASIPSPTKPKAPKVAPIKQEDKPQTQKEDTKAEAKVEIQARPTSRQSSASQNSARPSQRPSSAKPPGSDLFKAFAKAKPKAKKEEAPNVSGVESGDPSGVEDVVMDDDSEEEREDLFLDSGKRTSNKDRESRKEREEKLRKMMEDDDDDEMPDAPKSAPEESASVAEETTEAEKPKTETSEPPEPAPEPVKTTNGRRRGKRQVPKRKKYKDADGYLVTKEVLEWESFSEDETEPPKKRLPPVSTAKSTKGSQKTGQGSIMSFFGKK
ncbi:hypothetical protein CIRG_08763 [Coccidioides immitis RMSCC 2394]|uniref:DNA polymerase delta subunit 3 n=1 Tax=Coccidioides immitis RMSCC 2394 TaxID=404692 RepID=A0A0J7BFV4_COCIT|nr:hypothetical protein CIRG_08763 [Coccidioides immitis RMSCC 2394]